jgi:sugar O-acyltransferase (sialic acid O-acetyltransferase NeuD family)
MKDIYIFGAGGFAKEIYYTIKNAGEYIVKGFINKDIVQDVIVDNITIPVFSEDQIEQFCLEYQINAAIAIANNNIVEKVFHKFEGKCFFPNIIDPSIASYGEIIMGEGNIITRNNFFSDNVIIGSFNRINMCCLIGHDVTIGDFNIVNPSCKISGNVHIGNFNMLGVNSSILQGISLGNNNTIGGGSFLASNIDNNNNLLGVPARKFPKPM